MKTNKTKYPLRRVLHFENHPKFKNVLREVLECGHRVSIRSDFYGQTNSVRRRCRQCYEATISPASGASTDSVSSQSLNVMVTAAGC